MRLIRILFIFACLGMTAGPVFADSLSINLSDDAVRGLYSYQISDTGRYGALEGRLGMLYGNDIHGDEDVYVPHLGLMVTGNAGTPNVKAGLGLRLVYLNVGNVDGFSLAPGAAFEYSLPFMDRLGFGAHLYYAPDVVSIKDVQRYFEYGGRVWYEVLRNARVYAGYRQIKFELDSTDEFFNADSGYFIGMQLSY